jgi:hypothetical protein
LLTAFELGREFLRKPPKDHGQTAMQAEPTKNVKGLSG